ncbi:MAG: hypothetical protein DMG15_21205 [Acidobacteria bacterium]|nr:MAG: hypothetical protein DMG15_21205 [Acidobacteriota bacterium]
MQERLQKILAHAGIASRRHAEEIIQSGRVTVNGHLVMELGSKADPDEDVIKVDGKKIRPPQRHVYIVLNKPKNVRSRLREGEDQRASLPNRASRLRLGGFDHPHQRW